MTSAAPKPFQDQVDDDNAVFENKTYDVRGWCDVLCCAEKVLTLTNDSVEYHSNCVFGCHDDRSYPYGELSGVGTAKACGCCPGIKPGFPVPGPDGIVVGCCGDLDLTNEIVGELQKRSRQRGDIGQMKRTEEMQEDMKLLLTKVSRMESNLALVMKALKVAPAQEVKMT
mmetsp:Transcript_25913/g.36115  ORF Transcript_25913/g.36115 Transcript_25913/m.36115 type:complete len:170 (+) Transcript_25913:109-618(+)|eukprot:CAMPEP_0184479372 /NCGR_PEP_ID=MMETSP0113_2-20130426/1126_1 /TAXON_ID=91329 /ORGANISM="Norrisiella sphaerica, Strain BC52" /LENGTH=169 /DNA_ID=CAMNT_0026857443 /DNA_START=94 /DNA_END=603 /DNA_ORIENTATION=-